MPLPSQQQQFENPAQYFTPLPFGLYKVGILDVEEGVLTKRGDGSYDKIVLKVLEGSYSGRQFFERFNFDNPNPKTVEIAVRTFNAMKAAMGIPEDQAPENWSQVMGKPMVIWWKKAKKPDEEGKLVYMKPDKIQDAIQRYKLTKPGVDPPDAQQAEQAASPAPAVQDEIPF